MNNKKIEIRFITSWKEDEVVELYKAGGWWKESYNKSAINSMIAGSFVFAIAIDSTTGKAIGMGRVLSDGTSDAYIQDMVVLPAYQGLGIGERLVKSLIDHCISKGIVWIGLIAEPGKDSFYMAMGLKPMKDYIPMIYQMED
jgi:ribosomal protein S18 acetylase RimI-like enzyme